MAEKREDLLKSLNLLLPYPKTGSRKVSIGNYEDYQRLHSAYIRAYKQLYEDVATFSVLPERFVQQAEPVIEKYLEGYDMAKGKNEQKEWLVLITDFVSRFYDFMDEATEMFTEHQSLADETLTFLQKIASIETQHKNDNKNEQNKELILLIPELEYLATSLKVVREAVDTTVSHLQSLEPVWETIKSKISS